MKTVDRLLKYCFKDLMTRPYVEQVHETGMRLAPLTPNGYLVWCPANKLMLHIIVENSAQQPFRVPLPVAKHENTNMSSFNLAFSTASNPIKPPASIVMNREGPDGKASLFVRILLQSPR